jgi:hypothetical protein
VASDRTRQRRSPSACTDQRFVALVMKLGSPSSDS